MAWWLTGCCCVWLVLLACCCTIDLDHMRNQGPGSWGVPLTPEYLASLKDEQRAQLELLQKSAERLDDQWSDMEREENPVTKE